MIAWAYKMSLKAHLITVMLVHEAFSVKLDNDAQDAADTAMAMAYSELAAMDPSEREKLKVQVSSEVAAENRGKKIKSMPLSKQDQLSEDQAIAAFQL